LNNLEETEPRNIPPRLNQEETENLNRPITKKEVESVIKRKTKDPSASLLKSTKHLKNSTSPSQLFQRIEETLLNSFYEARIIRARQG
jgi:hypothetical protein